MRDGVRRIGIRTGGFTVLDRDPAQNYTDVTPMFAYMDDLGLGQDAVMLDVGANIGIFALSYAWLYDRATIHAFEPHRGTFETLTANLRLNGELADRIRAHNVGLSDRDGVAEMRIPSAEQHPRYDPRTNQINSGLFSRHGAGTDAVVCQFAALDTVASDFPRVDFIKVDVEGHEFEVLEGGTETIDRWRPIVTLEYNELTRKLSRHDPGDFEGFFRRRRYRAYGVLYGWQRQLRKLAGFHDVENVSDVVCVPDERVERLRSVYDVQESA